LEPENKEFMMYVKTISVHDTHELLSTDPATVLVCAYEKEEEFRQNDLEGAISLNEFRKRRNSIPKDESVIFYCACPHDEAALKQAKKYARDKFTNVNVLEGGVNAWKNAGYGLVESHR
jgi:rhodanese-related sulfurtransferase